MLTRKMTSLLTSALFSSLLLIEGVAYSKPAITQSGTIKMAGGTAHIAFMQDIGAKISQQNPDFTLLVAGGGSGVGVQKLGSGLVDLANTGRPLSVEEKSRYKLASHALAYDAITFIVNPENPVSNLSFSDLQKIFSGEIQSWEKWTKIPNQPIHVYVRDESSGTQDIFVERVLKNKKIARFANFTNSQGAMKLAISNDKNGIGFVGFGYLDNTVKDVRLNGHKASAVSIRSTNPKKRYPLVRKLYVNSAQKPSPLVHEFLVYLQGPESAEIIKKWGLVPIYKKK